jgi:hypothetical protein
VRTTRATHDAPDEAGAATLVERAEANALVATVSRS